MDFEQNDSHLSDPMSGATEPSSGSHLADSKSGASKPPMEPVRKGAGWKIFFGFVLVLSVMANIVLFMLLGVVAMFATGQRGVLTEEVVREGPARNKIAMITVQGIIHGGVAGDVYRQLKEARKDRHVKGIIVRVNSPGGTVSASDQIYNEICKFRKEEKKPVVAFMQGVAASGGYYTSVACEEIMAEPTTITGSIGVISWYLVVQELLEEKLGVLPVTIKQGEKKDWPSSFRKPEDEEKQYLREKVLMPAYERFVEVVAEGRKAKLTLDDVRRLADGGIFGAQEAVEENLIDEIGYLDDAIKLAKTLAKIDKARVVEYRKPFSLSDFMSYRKTNLLKLDRATLYELSTPQILYLWNAY